MSKNKKIISGLALAAVAFIIMMFSTMPSAGSKEITISDLAENGSKFEGDYIMTQGLLNKDSVKWDADKLELRFEIYEENQGTLQIFHKGIKPDNFTEDVIVLVEGFIKEDGVFEAEKVQTKCPTKYEGEGMENYDTQMHKEIYKNDKQD
ncbi:cytochrome c maturation protein CcmE [Mesobacillus subterraneus]|jgi:cytochrome c-type biogenesis protein CcmE|uniref:cytochrome c maturation protein CcmE n=1 Tax=Mesobacillus subterraneus TaxID=285983 RepID=UPI002040645B|nr:cytochrome c maturation protein CcmE [Mesobacillus subterraneus]MCM3665960.1 cytochrome c maturation protein CcmE [Mesobacillus subterraneus]MCM3684843.1 cytochrome c maturation protein CcmE [Mesobacillus subterraneus]